MATTAWAAQLTSEALGETKVDNAVAAHGGPDAGAASG